MKYALLKEVIDLVAQFESQQNEKLEYTSDIHGFRLWVSDMEISAVSRLEPEWEGKAAGRSAESVINTLIVHMNRYAKSYSKSAILDSEFSSQEDFIYLINLKAFGKMSKMDLIRKNVHEKPVGMQIINRLINKGWVQQTDSVKDKRSKEITITEVGKQALEKQMDKIRQATQIVTGDLSQAEKMELIRLLTKLDEYHQKIYDDQIDPQYLLDEASPKFSKS